MTTLIIHATLNMAGYATFLTDNAYLKTTLCTGGSDAVYREYAVHPLWKDREIYGEYHHLAKDLKNYPRKFKGYYRMTNETFEYLLQLVGPAIRKETTNFKKPISPAERLTITLR